MSLLDDLRSEFFSYAADNVTAEIDFPYQDHPPGSGQTEWNPEESAPFSVRIKNDGPMNIKNLKLHLVAGEYGEVRSFWLRYGGLPVATPSAWAPELVTPPLEIGAGRTGTVRGFQFRTTPSSETTALPNDLCVHIHTFDLSWDSMLLNRKEGESVADCVPITIQPKS